MMFQDILFLIYLSGVFFGCMFSLLFDYFSLVEMTLGDIISTFIFSFLVSWFMIPAVSYNYIRDSGFFDKVIIGGKNDS